RPANEIVGRVRNACGRPCAVDSVGNVVTSMDPELRRCLAEAIAEDDRLRAEDEREAVRVFAARKSGEEAILYRVFDENSQETPLNGGAGHSDGLVADEVVELVADAIHNTEQRAERKLAEAMESARAEWQLRLEREVGTLRAENAELRGFLGGLLAAFAPRLDDASKSGQVVDLVPWRGRDGT